MKRKQILQIKQHVCHNVECEITKSNIKIPVFMLDVHHVDGNTNNNDIHNLELLCHWCHTKFHRTQDAESHIKAQAICFEKRIDEFKQKYIDQGFDLNIFNDAPKPLNEAMTHWSHYMLIAAIIVLFTSFTIFLARV